MRQKLGWCGAAWLVLGGYGLSGAQEVVLDPGVVAGEINLSGHTVTQNFTIASQSSLGSTSGDVPLAVDLS